MPLILELKRQSQADLSKFKANMVFIVPRIARTTQ